jgi:hypothetical protein
MEISRGIAVVVVILIVIAVFWSFSQKPQQEPTRLTFSFDFPKSIVPGQSKSATITVTNNGGDASRVTPVLLSDAVTVSSGSVDLKKGTTTTITLTITGKDIVDGSYALIVFLQYSNQLGMNKTDSKGTSIYLLPHVEFTNVRYQTEYLLFTKDTIGKSDSTNLLFQVQSMSSSTIYNGMTASIRMSMNVPGLSATPTSLPIGSLGPNGKTTDYSFKILSNNTPPGKYSLQISLYSKDNQLITQTTMPITVTP